MHTTRTSTSQHGHTTTGLRSILLICWLSTSAVSWAESPEFSVASGGAVLRVYAHDANADFEPDRFRDWIQYSADIVSKFYGRFPVDDARVDLYLFPGGGMTSGNAYGEPEPRVAVTVGIYSELADLKKDWRLIHEMIHLAFPRVPQRHRWITEGLATYLESIVRTQAGELDPGFVWRGFRDGMPNGLPKGSEGGLDGTTRWGRVYWGGAMFCLYADLEIRRQTENRKELRDAMRAILDAGLDHRDESELLPLLQIGDDATGTGVLTNLYDTAGKSRWEPDLDRLWHQFGVPTTNQQTFDDSATLAEVRRSITGGQ